MVMGITTLLLGETVSIPSEVVLETIPLLILEFQLFMEVLGMTPLEETAMILNQMELMD